MKWLASLRRENSDSEIPGAADPGDVANGPSPDSPLVDSPSPAPEAAPRTSADDEGSPDDGPVPVAGAAQESSAGLASPPDAESTRKTVPECGTSLSDAFEKLREELLEKQLSLGDGQRQLNELFATRLRSDEAQGRAVEKLHDELRQYKANFIRQQTLPLLKEVIFCHDFIVGQLDRLAANAEATAAHAPLDATRQMLIDLLFKYDVEPFRAEEERFDPKSQQCTQTVPTSSAEADKTIAARGLPGFRGPDGIVRREQVSVYKFTPGAD